MNLFLIQKKIRTNQSGQIVMLSTIFFLILSMIIIVGLTNPIIRQQNAASELLNGRASLFLSEAGIEDVLYRLKNGKSVSSSETLTLGGNSATISTSNTLLGKQVTVSGDVKDAVRQLRMQLVNGTGVSFHYGIQSGNGGFLMQNSSSVTGNVYSGGSVIGSGGNYIYGDVISSGSSGSVYGIHATGTVYAHNIGIADVGTQIDKDAYYQTITNTTVNGIKYPNSTDQSASDLPISDAQISQWESDAAAGGTLASSFCDDYKTSTNTCTISSTKSLGPKKIPFNLIVKSSSAIFTVTGPLWVVGDITLQTGPTIKMSSSLGSQNVPIIADDTSNRGSKGIITIGQSTIFQNSGSANSFVFMISQNNNAENGGTTDAISLQQSSSALVAYASHGQITLSQSANVKEVTAYKIKLTQTANVTYDTGLPSVVFQAGPAGGYDISSWGEI